MTDTLKQAEELIRKTFDLGQSYANSSSISDMIPFSDSYAINRSKLLRLVSELEEENKEKQAEINRLMLKYCPDEMSINQLNEHGINYIKSITEGKDSE